MSKNADNLIWIDLEMTGLNPDQDRIIEVATIVTDKNCEVLEEGPVLAIHQDDDILNGMDEWCTKQHTNSGLVDRVRASTLSEAEAEAETLAFLETLVPGGVSPMCGNSICMDKRFMAKYMPKLCGYFHYRMIDVSTIKELARRWRPVIYDGFKKDSQHLALQDIYDSINELLYYRKHFFV